MTLKQWRLRELKLSQSKLAKKLGCTKSTIISLENRRRKPGSRLGDLIYQLSKGKVSYDEMYKLPKVPTPIKIQPKWMPPDKFAFIEDYTNMGMTSQAMAKKYKVCYNTILRRLKEYGIKIR
jgi:DNA-binding XRE family transcriptional regulator